MTSVYSVYSIIEKKGDSGIRWSESAVYRKNKTRRSVNEQRKTWQQTRIYTAERRVRHRNRKRLEVSVYRRAERRRIIRNYLSDVPGDTGNSGADDGVLGRQSSTAQSGEDVSAARTEGHEVAYPRRCRDGRQLYPADVLHNGRRVDAAVLLLHRGRSALRTGRCRNIRAL